MSKKVTMQHIADSLGVSKFVVSKALSGKEGVSDATKARVMETAAQLGYFNQKNGYLKAPLPTKSEVSDPQRNSVLVLMPNIRFQTKTSAYWGRILEGISEKLDHEGVGMVIVAEQSVEHFMQLLNPKALMGIIGVGEVAAPLLLEAHRLGLPIVLIDHEDELIPADTLFADNFESMHRLTRHLIGTGHRELVFVGDARYSRSFYDRYLGFNRAMEEAGIVEPAAGSSAAHYLPVQGFEKEHFIDSITRWAAEKMDNGKMPAALVCANDQIALAALTVLQRLNCAVPDDVSVTGFDHIEDTDRTSPRITTVRVPKHALGRRAVELLQRRVHEREAPAEKVLLACELLYRESSGLGKQR
ncbi:periplasmic binding protein/LacI transcriptional regulator [Paenibacillus algicola]|uniref:Periplasmic binding protein/LacI transcriptional regulator n=1 Tax=Paenibacillus algicola TaxID=2565926 RepID=A0A4P8XH86_9BACL|nr:LacI family DNA-binding transcriptional regulator [Paenibacillus algicola]QCT01523.1 periplasmic binding protein/LacI transcriptional regulator [Paenibacillus algicola]